MSSHYTHENAKDDDARPSVTVSSSVEAHHPRNSSNPEEIVRDDASTSIEKHDDDIDPPQSKSSEPTLTPAAAPDPDLVVWDGPNDPENPQTWSVRRKWMITASSALMTLCVYVAETSFVA
jgi:MFS transporter, DHA1 family, multidrug resistance protein